MNAINCPSIDEAKVKEDVIKGNMRANLPQQDDSIVGPY